MTKAELSALLQEKGYVLSQARTSEKCRNWETEFVAVPADDFYSDECSYERAISLGRFAIRSKPNWAQMAKVIA